MTRQETFRLIFRQPKLSTQGTWQPETLIEQYKYYHEYWARQGISSVALNPITGKLRL